MARGPSVLLGPAWNFTSSVNGLLSGRWAAIAATY